MNFNKHVRNTRRNVRALPLAAGPLYAVPLEENKNGATAAVVGAIVAAVVLLWAVLASYNQNSYTAVYTAV